MDAAQFDRLPASLVDGVGLKFRDEFREFQADRQLWEQQWLMDIRQYKGIYEPEVLAGIGPGKCRIFSRLTRKKIKTADSKIMDLLFPNGRETNWDLDATPVPSIDPTKHQEIIQILAASIGRMPSEDEQLGVIREFSKTRAARMKEVVKDQLNEAGYRDIVGEVIHSGNLYGTGILKGPLVERKARKAWVLQGDEWVMSSDEELKPFISHVSLWSFFPDMSAAKIDDARCSYERHIFSKHRLAELIRRPTFDAEKIRAYLAAYQDGDIDYTHWEVELMNIGNATSIRPKKVKRFEALERWGVVDGYELADCGVDVPEGMENEQFWANIWLLGPMVIKAVLSPIEGVESPYHLYYYDKDESSIFGEGLASILRDDQRGFNAATRASVDNAGYSSGPQMEVNTDLLDPSENPRTAGAGRIWLRTGLGVEAQYPAVRYSIIPNNTEQFLKLRETFEQQAHEMTLPSYMHGEQDQGVGRTVGGLSMLMGAANIEMKEQVRHFDEGVTKPFIRAMYHWNMNFNPREDIKGDFEVSASGSTSLIAREVRGQQLNEFAAMTANPVDAVYVKRHKLLQKIANVFDLGDDVVMSDDEVQQERQAAMSAGMMQPQPVANG